MAEDIVDGVSHVMDVCLGIDLLTVSVDNDGSLGFFGGPSNFSFSLCTILATLAQVPVSTGCCGGGVRVGSTLLLSLNGSWFLCTLGVHRLSVGIGGGGGGGVLC